MKKVLKAIRFAQKAHEGQVRKHTGEPYIVHPLRVAALVGSVQGFSDEVVMAAVLHDVLEDTDITVNELRKEFGYRVVDMVEELTNPSHASEHRGKPRAERKALDLEHARRMSLWAGVIKAADRIDNLSDMSGAGDDFLVLYTQESRALWEVLDLRLPLGVSKLFRGVIEGAGDS